MAGEPIGMQRARALATLRETLAAAHRARLTAVRLGWRELAAREEARIVELERRAAERAPDAPRPGEG